jgi:hypothetical protein
MIVRGTSGRFVGLRRGIVQAFGALTIASGLIVALGQRAQAAGAPVPQEVLAPMGGQSVSNTGRNVAIIVACVLIAAVIVILILLMRRRKDDDQPTVAPPSAGPDAAEPADQAPVSGPEDAPTAEEPPAVEAPDADTPPADPAGPRVI